MRSLANSLQAVSLQRAMQRSGLVVVLFSVANVRKNVTTAGNELYCKSGTVRSPVSVEFFAPSVIKNDDVRIYS